MKQLVNNFFSWVFALGISLAVFIGTASPVLALPPTNFQSTPIITSGLDGPSGFEIAPDGRIFILERTGKIKIFKNGLLLLTPFAELPSVATGDRGLIGIAFDPDYASNQYVYFYYTGLDLLNHLVRFSASGDVGTDGPVTIYQTNSPSQELHVGGSIRFGLDDKMYFAVGDNGYPPNAQNLANPHGKILRINKDGTVPTDNPFVNTPGALPEIWAYGFRNPWRFQFDSLDGRLYGGDVGDFTTEEVNYIEKGKNYGWPTCEGPCNEPGITNPIYSYLHDDLSSAVTGGPVYRSLMFPGSYQGSLFFGDYARGFIKRIILDGNGGSAGVSDFDLNAGSVVDLKIAPDGAMYYLTYIPGRLYRVTYSTGNQTPAAFASADKLKGIEPLTVNFSSEGSSDPENDPLTFNWDFGDGTSSTEANPTHTYNNKGTYTVELIVSDGVNQNQSIPLTIQVGTPPTVNIGAPLDGSTYRAGDKILYSSSAIDGAGYDISDGDMTTEIIFHHLTHIHPFLGPIVSKNGEFTIPPTGEHSDQTWFEIKITALDRANSLSTSKSVFIYPVKSEFTVGTSIAGLQYLIDGVPYNATNLFKGVVGFFRELSAPIVQELSGVLYVFDHWSDGGFLRHFIVTPEQPTTFAATYNIANDFSGEYFNNVNLNGQPTLTRTEKTIDFNWGGGSPDPSIQTDNFSARWSGTQHFVTGKYKFTTTTDDGVRLYIDNNLVIDKWVDQSSGVNTATLDLAEGNHQIKMEYYEAYGGALAKLTWDEVSPPPPTPTLSPVTGGYDAAYFDNKTLTGVPKLTRVDPEINFDWSSGSPDVSLPLDLFSARWIRDINFEAGDYQFNVRADDGVRVYLDGVVIIDQWILQPPTDYQITKTLTAGNHNLKIEYYENYGGAVMQFNYQKIASPTPTPTPTPTPSPLDGYSAKFWNVSPGSHPIIPQTNPDLTRIDPAINFDFKDLSPDPLINTDHFIGVWQKDQDFVSGKFEFSIEADDGVRLYIDNELIIDQWNDQAATIYKAQKQLTAGVHNIKIEYYENYGDSVIKFGYLKIGEIDPPSASQYNAKYWNLPVPENKPQIPTTPANLEVLETMIDHDWDNDSAIPGVHDGFIGEWTKTQSFEDGNYEFKTESDDGIRVYVDDVLLIDQWNDHARKTDIGNKIMTAGNHNIKVQYYDYWGKAVAIFDFKKI